jgi:hypothetical protein
MSTAGRQRLVLAIASGKGGVGKTMLAAAIAKELSRRRRTLLVDLDFFNRGLAGLLPRGQLVATLPKPAFLVTEAGRSTSVYREQEGDGLWRLVEVAPDLVAVAYGDVSEAEMAALERLGVEGSYRCWASSWSARPASRVATRSCSTATAARISLRSRRARWPIARCWSPSPTG